MKIAKMPDGTPEVYLAVNGEGMTTGLPTVFVRTSSCNLHCTFCDTFYTWNFEGTKFSTKHDYAPKVNMIAEQMVIPSEELAKIIIEKAGNVRAVTFTGGEPTIQQFNIVSTIQELKKQSKDEWFVEVETNGTLMLQAPFVKLLDQINCSPKLSSSGNEKILRQQEPVIRSMYEIAQFKQVGLCFKFVIRQENLEHDMQEVKEWQKDMKMPSKYIYLMPEGIEKDKILEGTAVLEEICMETGYKLSTRLQILIHGPKRAT